MNPRLFIGMLLVSVLGGLRSFAGADYVIALYFLVAFPLSRKQNQDSGEQESLFFRIPILVIIIVMTLRVILDAFVPTIITPGPWKIAYLSGLLYLVYFTFHRYLDRQNASVLIMHVIKVATIMSVVNLVQVYVPALEVVAGTRSEVGGTFVRYQSVYYHFSVLATLLISYLLSAGKIQNAVSYALMAALNLITIIITGYRATLFVLIGCLGIFLLRFWGNIERATKAGLLVLSLPFIMYIYGYTVERNLETTKESEGDTSLMYRLLEAGMGIEKLEVEDSWTWGIGYADGFLNEWGGVVGGQETYFLHNGYLSILYNYGIVGAIAWSLLVVAIIIFIVRNARRMKNNPLFILIALYIVGQLIVNYSSGVFNREPSVTFCFFFALAMLEKIVKYSVVDGVPWEPFSSGVPRHA